MDVLYYLCGFLCLVQMPIIMYWREYYYIEEDTFLENLGFYVMCTFDPIFPFLLILALTGWCRHVGYSVTSICDGIVDGAAVLNFAAWAFALLTKKVPLNAGAFLFAITIATIAAA